jgi:hypothetical protein
VIGAVILVVVLVVVIPVGFLMSTTLAAGVLGWSLTTDAETRHEGSELVDLNR